MKKILTVIISILLISMFVLPVFADDSETAVPLDTSEYEQFILGSDYDSDSTEVTYEMPSWWPEDVNSFTDFHNEDAPRIVDDADIFSSAAEERLTQKIYAAIQATGADFVIYTDTTNYGLGNQMCAADFYQFNGYGIGDDYNGSVLFVNMDPNDREYYTAARGDCRKYYTEETLNSLQDRCYDNMASGDYEDAMNEYIDAMVGLYKTGKVPEESGAFLLRLIVCIVVGLIGGAIAMGVLVSDMKKVKIATRAREYLVRDSVNMRAANDFFLYASVVRTKIPKNDGKGGSSFSGGFSSHGGGSFSGGGRRF